MSARLKARLILFFLALLIIISAIFLYQQVPPNFKTLINPSPNPIAVNNSPTPKIIYEKADVLRVIDGDTIELQDKRRVRYIGINAPETKNPKKTIQCFGEEASKKNKELVEGKTIYLEKDISETDKYNRLLRYVYLDNPQTNNNALFVNEYLVKEGYAQVSTFPPDVKYKDLFLASQQEAKKNKAGLWSKCL